MRIDWKNLKNMPKADGGSISWGVKPVDPQANFSTPQAPQQSSITQRLPSSKRTGAGGGGGKSWGGVGKPKEQGRTANILDFGAKITTDFVGGVGKTLNFWTEFLVRQTPQHINNMQQNHPLYQGIKEFATPEKRAEYEGIDSQMDRWVKDYEGSFDALEKKGDLYFFPNLTKAIEPTMKELSEGVEAEWLPEWENASLKDKFGKDFSKTLYVTSQSVLTSALTLFATKSVSNSNWLASATFASQSAEDIKNLAIASGVERGQANRLALGFGIPIAVLEKVGFDQMFGSGLMTKWGIGFFGKFLNSKLANVATKTTQSMLIEGFTETAQEEVQMMAESTFMEVGLSERATRDVMSWFGGVLGGLFIGGASAVTQTYSSNPNANKTMTPEQIISENTSSNPEMRARVDAVLDIAFEGKVLTQSFVDGVLTDVEAQISKYNNKRKVELTKDFELVKAKKYKTFRDLIHAINQSLPADIDTNARKLYVEQSFQHATSFSAEGMEEVVESQFEDSSKVEKTLFGLREKVVEADIYMPNLNNMPVSDLLDEPRQQQEILDQEASENVQFDIKLEDQMAQEILGDEYTISEYNSLMNVLNNLEYKQELVPLKQLQKVNEDTLYSKINPNGDIVVDQDGRIISGIDTYLQAIKDGRTTVPTYVPRAVDSKPSITDLKKYASQAMEESKMAQLDFERDGEKAKRLEAELKQDQEIQMARETPDNLKYEDADKERNYQNFKKLAQRQPLALESATDEIRLKTLVKRDLDMEIFGSSGQLTNDEMLAEFKQRYAQEQTLRTSATQKTSVEVAVADRKTAGKIIKEATVKPKKALIPRVTKMESTALKDRLKAIAKGARIGAFATKQEIKRVQTQLLDLLEQSDLEAEDRDKFRRTIKNTQTKKQFDKLLPQLEQRIDALVEKSKKRVLVNKITNELKTSKVKRPSGKPQGKFTPEIQNALNLFIEASKLTSSEARLKIKDNLERTEAGISTYEQATENKILELGSGLKEQSSTELTNVLKNITSLKSEGRMLNELSKFNRQGEIDSKVAKSIEVLTGKKGVAGAVATEGVREAEVKGLRNRLLKHLKNTGKSIVGWIDIMDMLSSLDKESKPFQSFLNTEMDVLDQENAEKKGTREQFKELNQIIRDSYDIKSDRQISKLIRNSNKEKDLGTFVNLQGETVNLKFTKAEAIKRYMEFQDETLDETWTEGMHYTPEIKNAITGMLSTNDKAYAHSLLNFYAEYRTSINEVYETMNGASMGNVTNYSPIVREGFEGNESGTSEFLQEVPYRASINMGAFNDRVKNILPIGQQSVFHSLEKHVVEAEHYKAWAEKLREVKAVLQNPKTKTAISVYHGKSMNGMVNNFLEDFTRGGDDMSSRLTWLDKFRGQYTRAVLASKPTIGIKQLTSFPAYANAIPVASFTAGTMDFFTNPVGKTKFLLKNSILLQERGQNMERDIRVAMKSKEASNFRKNPTFLNKLMLNVQLGDKGAIVMGGWSVYRYNYKQALKNGSTEKEAQAKGIRAFEQVTRDTQQSADLSAQSKMQRGGSFAKLFTMFQSSPNQYFRKEIGAVRGIVSGRGSKAQHAKTIAIFHFLLPMLFQFVSSGFKWEKEKQLRAGILGAFNGVFILGDMMESIIDKAVGNRVYPNEIPIYGVVDDVIKGMKLIEGDLSEEDVLKAIRGVAGVFGSLTGTPLKYGVDLFSGINKMIEGEEGGLSNILGFPASSSSSSKKKTSPASIQLYRMK